MLARLGHWLGVLFVASGLWGCGLTSNSAEPASEPPPSTAGGDGSAGAAQRNQGGASGADRASSAGSAGLGMAPSSSAGSAPVDEQPVRGEPHAARPCANPQPFNYGGGYVVCEDHSLRRGEPAECISVLPRAKPTEPLVYDECTLDTDCGERAHGLCAYGACEYRCVGDADCAEGQLCFCGEEAGKCLAAACTSDADCPADYPCTGNHPFGTDEASFQCQSPLDACESDYDCNGSNPRAHCVSNGERRECITDQIG